LLTWVLFEFKLSKRCFGFRRSRFFNFSALHTNVLLSFGGLLNRLVGFEFLVLDWLKNIETIEVWFNFVGSLIFFVIIRIWRRVFDDGRKEVVLQVLLVF
jgi:glycopeptide antibiotics resistance protein